jgi:hypothetical protein
MVIKTMDPVWIRIRFQSEVPDPDSKNPDPKHWNLDRKNEAADLQTTEISPQPILKCVLKVLTKNFA